MVAATLTQLDAWYQEPTAGPERPKLLSKMAILELCGWIETEQDRMITHIGTACVNDAEWIRREVIERTFGFEYNKHFRPMLTKILGEHLVRKLETNLDSKHPGDLDQLKSYMGELWIKRCSFAHADLAAHIRTQQRFDAPSWSQNRHRVISRSLTRLEAEAIAIVGGL